jgi:hypothetical protein
MKRLLAAWAFIASTAVADELHSVEPKTLIDEDTFYVSVRLLGVDAPEGGDRAKCDQEPGFIVVQFGELMRESLNWLIGALRDLGEFFGAHCSNKVTGACAPF